MSTRVFDTQQLIDWGIHHHGMEACEHVVYIRDLGLRDFEVECEIVFNAPDDGKLWRFAYKHDITKLIQDVCGVATDRYVESPHLGIKTAAFRCTEVVIVTKLVEVTTYEPAP